eukprot:TRINITY_DN57430_c0_g1_i1.p2 TRINITY_DN57430_c0_g1~~TRINITY_DN57430_c0_g1_i1.p2  ORF type:complete len:180 (-),score=28.26 TRINITY_DN57430_c0_g1_i1:23-505(-)
MGDGACDGDGGAAASTAPASASSLSAAEVIRVGVEPCGPASAEAPLTVQVAFKTTRCLADVRWRLRFLPDVVSQPRPCLDLAESEVSTFPEGSEHTVELRAERGLPIAQLPPTAVENLGLLEVLLVDAAGTELASTRLVTDVRRSADGKGFVRGVLDPLA